MWHSGQSQCKSPEPTIPAVSVTPTSTTAAKDSNFESDNWEWLTFVNMTKGNNSKRRCGDLKYYSLKWENVKKINSSISQTLPPYVRSYSLIKHISNTCQWLIPGQASKPWTEQLTIQYHLHPVIRTTQYSLQLNINSCHFFLVFCFVPHFLQKKKLWLWTNSRGWHTCLCRSDCCLLFIKDIYWALHLWPRLILSFSDHLQSFPHQTVCKLIFYKK